MRKFEVYLDKNVVGCEPTIEVVEMPDDATDKECDAECESVLQIMISNEIDSGWYERWVEV